MTSLDPKIIMREKGIETAKPIHPASWFRDRRLQIYYRRHVLERMTGYPEVNDGAFQLPDCRRLVRNCWLSSLTDVFGRRLRPYSHCLWKIPGYRSYRRFEREIAACRLSMWLRRSGRWCW